VFGFVYRFNVSAYGLLLDNKSDKFNKGCRLMGFAWIGSLLVFSWAFFTLGRKYQDFQDIMLARRVTRLIEQRKQVREGNEIFQEAESLDPRLAKFEKRQNEVKKI
jgi:hypothetical protein